MKPEVADESVEDTFDLPIPPDFPLPDAAFAFPECRVSSSALELLDLVKIYSISNSFYVWQVRKGLEYASVSKALTAARLFHTVEKLDNCKF